MHSPKRRAPLNREIFVAAGGLIAAAIAVYLSWSPSPARAELIGHGGFVKGIDLSADDRRVVSAGFDYAVMVWDLEAQEQIGEFWDHEAAVNGITFLPGDQQALSASDDGTLLLWGLPEEAGGGAGEVLARFEGHQGKVQGVAVSPDGRFAASAGWDGKIGLWDLKKRQLVRFLEGHGSNVNTVAFSPDGKLLASGGHENLIKLWSVPDGTARGALQGHDFAITSLAFLPDGRLASAGIDESLRLWDLTSFEQVAKFTGHEGPVFSVAVAPDGIHLATGGMDRVIRVWSLELGHLEKVLLGHEGPVWSLAFTADSQQVVSAGADRMIRVWDIASGGEIGEKQPRTSLAAVDLPEPDSRGAALYRACAVCHTHQPGGGKRAGPTLYQVFGRQAGTVEGYRYSDALAGSDIIWTGDTISALFREGPHIYTPGSKMPVQKVESDADRAELIAYLERITAPQEPAAPSE